MPRVLHLYKDLFPPVYGGIEVVLGKLAASQAERGWEVAVAVAGPVDREWGERRKVETIQVGEWARVLSNPISPGFFKVLRERPYDLLHIHMPCPTAEMAALFAGSRDVPWFATYQSDIVRQRISGALYAPLQDRFLSRCSAIYVSSENLLASSPVLQRHRERCLLAPLGISPETPTEEDRAAAAKVKKDYEGKPVVLFVGRFRWYKGLHVLIEAMDSVDATLLVVGSGTPQQERALQGRLNNLNHPERIRFLGSVERLEPLLLAADVFCLPSTHRAEAFGYVLLEAFRLGLPAVTTELSTGTSFVNEDGVTGRVALPSDAGSLASALNDVLSDPQRREAYGAAALRRVTEKFGLSQMVERILEGYARAGLALD
jgi:rhamnosyl/mannosyltransferase